MERSAERNLLIRIGVFSRRSLLAVVMTIVLPMTRRSMKKCGASSTPSILRILCYFLLKRPKYFYAKRMQIELASSLHIMNLWQKVLEIYKFINQLINARISPFCTESPCFLYVATIVPPYPTFTGSIPYIFWI